MIYYVDSINGLDTNAGPQNEASALRGGRQFTIQMRLNLWMGLWNWGGDCVKAITINSTTLLFNEIIYPRPSKYIFL